MNITVTDKAVTINGHEMWVKLLEIDGTEGWIGQQVQEYFGFKDSSAVRHCADRAGQEGDKMSRSQLKTLKQNNLISIRTGYSTFYSKAQVLEMAMYATSDSAKELIRHAFDITEAVYKGDIKAAQTLAGFSEDVAIEHLETAIQGWKTERAAHKVTQLELVQTTTMYEVAKESALTSAKMVAERDKAMDDLKADIVDIALKLSVDSAYIHKHFPLIVKASKRWRATQSNRDSTKYGPNGWISMYLKNVHEISQLIQKEKPRGDAYIYSLSQIKRVNEVLTNVKGI